MLDQHQQACCAVASIAGYKMHYKLYEVFSQLWILTLPKRKFEKSINQLLRICHDVSMHKAVCWSPVAVCAYLFISFFFFFLKLRLSPFVSLRIAREITQETGVSGFVTICVGSESASEKRGEQELKHVLSRWMYHFRTKTSSTYPMWKEIKRPS